MKLLFITPVKLMQNSIIYPKMIKHFNPFSWFNKKVRTKDDLQFLVVLLLVLFMVFTKCYMIVVNRAEAKQVANTSILNLNWPFINTHYSTIK